MRTVAGRFAVYFGLAFFGLLPFVFSKQLLDPVRYPQLMIWCLGMVPILVFLVLRRESKAAQGRGRASRKSQTGTGSQVAARTQGEPKSWKVLLQAPSSWVWGLALPLFLLTALSMTWALNPAEAWFTSIHFGLCLVFLFLSREMLARVPDLLHIVVKVLVVSMSLLATVGILQKLGIDPLGTSIAPKTPTATMANPNFYGDALLLGLPFCLYGFFKSRTVAWHLISGIAVLILCAGIVVSGTRSCLMPLLLTAIFFPPVIIWRKWRNKTRWMALGAWIIILTGLIWSSGYIFRNKEGTFNFHYIWEGHAVEPTTSSVDYRFITWNHTLQLVGEQPFTGVGAGNWKMEIQRTGLKGYDDNDGYGLKVPVQPHNDYLGILAELGIPGLLLVLGIGAIGVASAFRMALGHKDHSDSVLGVCLLMAWLCFFFDANFSFPIERPFQSMMLFWILAVSLSQGSSPASPTSTQTAQQTPARTVWKPILAYILCTILLIAGGLTLLSRIQADQAKLELREQYDAHQPARMLQTAERAQNWSTQLDPVSATPIDWYVGMAHEELGQLPQALAAFERALEVSPHHLAVRSGYASLLDMAGRSAEAAQMLSELLIVFPDYEEGWLNLSIMQVHAGQYQAGRQSLSKLRPRYAPEKYQLVDKTLRDAGY